MSSTLRIIYRSDSSVTPEEARAVRARVWAYIFACHAKKKGGVPSTADDGKEFRDVPATTNSIK